MKVFKFGGGIIKDAAAIRKLAELLMKFSEEYLLLVISAMGKTTNELEKLAYLGFHKDPLADEQLEKIRKDHFRVMLDLFMDKDPEVFEGVTDFFNEIEYRLKRTPADNYDHYYDQLVSYGELVSSYTVCRYLNSCNINCCFLDARELVRTDSHFRHASVNMEKTSIQVREKVIFEGNSKICVTQGFIGADEQNQSATLGREGSDFSAAVFGNILDAEEVVFWKDVSGIYNADPKRFAFARKIDRLSYDDAVKLTNLGAKILHSKTIAPLKEKNIPAQVREFSTTLLKGTFISGKVPLNKNTAVVISEENLDMITFTGSLNEKEKFKTLLSDELLVSNIFISKFTGQDSMIVCLYPDREIIAELTAKYSGVFTIEVFENVDVITVLNANEGFIGELLTGFKMLHRFDEKDHLILVLTGQKNEI